MEDTQLEEDYEAVTYDFLEMISRLYLAQHGADDSVDPPTLHRYIQMQLATLMSSSTANLPGKNILSTRLRELQEQNYNNDNAMYDKLRALSQLMQDFAQQRSEYLKLIESTRPLYETLRKNYKAKTIQSRQLRSQDTATQKTRELLIALIIQGSYQGTETEIDEWLEHLAQ
ncbi:HDL312Cp [Eremothecium sinecaudum]|uniref:HDL312Cp n=1 Tax=Eremothecium sinecaudum TaxID=45286 RepID=A0A109UWW6_9SACH|nr:HDL312Cp [Eremothecium sinecaudum]AMD20432.1 HDL312Cp [Eremothecium sinecaudum]